VLVHLFAEVVAARCKVENHVEIFFYPFEETVVKLVTNGWLRFDCIASVL